MVAILVVALVAVMVGWGSEVVAAVGVLGSVVTGAVTVVSLVDIVMGTVVVTVVSVVDIVVVMVVVLMVGHWIY